MHNIALSNLMTVCLLGVRQRRRLAQADGQYRYNITEGGGVNSKAMSGFGGMKCTQINGQNKHKLTFVGPGW